MKNKLERRYGQRHLHFITCSCYRRLPLLGSAAKRDPFLEIFNEARTVSIRDPAPKRAMAATN